ncbi:hypothetical protein, partial [Methylophaga muralis]|uniref:hypothetical protein n=1 Tax=Methylophaga muralis TaxID=291169 RepID=UPI00114CAE8F
MKYKVMIPSILALVSQSASLLAAEYILGASFSPTLSYDDNVLLNEDSDSSFKTQIRPTLSFSRLKENSSLLFSSGLNVERYTELKDLD